MKVRLTSEAITKLKIENPYYYKIRRGLLGVTGKSAPSTIWILLKTNDWNSDLTKEAALQYLEDSLRMTRNQLIEIANE